MNRMDSRIIDTHKSDAGKKCKEKDANMKVLLNLFHIHTRLITAAGAGDMT